MSKLVSFVCSDESVNVYGFRVLTDGIRTKNFNANPVLFFNHKRGDGWLADNSYTGPLGRWENITKTDGQLIADPVFDLNDPKGKILADKTENDFIRAASIGFQIIATSNDPKLMLPGQTGPTVTQCELIEISVVDIPANKSALACYDKTGHQIDLTDKNALMTCLSAGLPVPLIENLKPNNMKLTFLKAWTFLAAFLTIDFGTETKVEKEISEAQLAELNTKLEKLATAESAVAKLSSDLQASASSVTKLTGDLQTAQASVTKLTTDLQTAATANTALVAELETANAAIATLKGTVPAVPVGKPSGEKPEHKDTGSAVPAGLAELMAFDFNTSFLTKEELAATD